MPSRTVERDGGFLRGNALWWLALALGLLLRLWFLRHPMPLDDDTDLYSELAKNLFHHGIYGSENDGTIVPSLIRLPGYPLFLGVLFALFGSANFTAVLIVQICIDLLGCWLIASFVREQVSERAGTVAMFLAALCPFTAAYSTIALTECLSVFAVSLALWSAGRLLRAQAEQRQDRAAVVTVSIAMALATLLRPDGVLVSAAVVAALLWYGWRKGRLAVSLKTALLCGILAVLPLVPWALRNWRTFHVIQPLAPRRVNEPGEYVTYGFYRWMSTWSVDYVSTGNVFWKVGTETIDIDDLPSRAFDSAAQREKTAEVLAEYNVQKTVTPQLDAKFAELAQQRLTAHPLLCRVWVPLLRVTDMALRPRSETLGLDADWWRFDRHRDESMEAVGLGLINLLIVGAALVGWLRGRAPWAALAVVYVLLRCVLLSTMENSEPRYTLEAMPILLAFAACALAGSRASASQPTPAAIEQIAI
ncbi:MAG TPA: glycosyltransferase family 39 protein [Acidobacteriaceae bacterium]|jgi:4-amino-4-deoxy-L-arabinose transferase-like glycosyltransferase